jgi:hypothetical protein
MPAVVFNDALKTTAPLATVRNAVSWWGLQLRPDKCAVVNTRTLSLLTVGSLFDGNDNRL